MKPAIRVTDLRKRYGTNEVLRGLHFEVPVGSIYGILGPNGAGKSTLIKLLVGAARPSAGTVEILGEEAGSDLRHQIGYMPQLPALYEDLSAYDNVQFFGRAHPIDDTDRRVVETLAFVGLAERQHDPVFTFSGGMKQRVSLACALVHQPKVLFLDEPTAGVDPKLRERFWEHFRALAAQGVTIVLSTHLMDEALLCDQLTILRDGDILTSAPPRELMQRGKIWVSVTRGEECTKVKISQYATELPLLLQKYQLDPAVSKIELEEEPLESIIIQMIEEGT